MKKHLEKIKKHIIKKQHHYKLALLFILLFAIFFFAHTVGNGAHQAGQFACRYDKDCSVNQFCEFDTCSSETGKCIDIPEVCPSLWDPVCGCDGNDYPNDCVRRVSKISKEHDGVCA